MSMITLFWASKLTIFCRRSLVSDVISFSSLEQLQTLILASVTQLEATGASTTEAIGLEQTIGVTFLGIETVGASTAEAIGLEQTIGVTFLGIETVGASSISDCESERPR